MTDQQPTAVTRLSIALTAWQAWWEDNDSWDGYALYLDLDTAKAHAAYNYEGWEYGWPDEDDDEPRTRPNLTWAYEHGSWHLLEDGKNTLVQVSQAHIYRPSTERETKAWNALQAAEEAARAAQPRRPLAEALEAAAGSRTTPAT